MLSQEFLFLNSYYLIPVTNPNSIFQWIDTTFTAYFFYNTFKYVLIPFLIVIILYFLFTLLFNRYNVDKIDVKKNDIEAELNNFLTELLYSNYSFEEVRKKVNEFKKKPEFQYKWCKYLILNKLIHIKHNVKELDKNLILIIYKQFDLHEYSKKLINKRKWYYKSLGFYHYQSLDYKIKKSNIKPYLNNKNKYLKSNALIALIALSDEKFDILNNYEEKISKADELKILDLIYHKKSSVPETIQSWLNSKNSSVVVLAIKLMVRYRETLSLPMISYLLLNDSTEVRKETIIAVRDLVIFNAKEQVMHAYKREHNERNKISILKTLSVIGDDTVKEFAIKLLEEEKNVDIAFEIVNCINKLDPNYFENAAYNSIHDKETINQIVLHLNSPYLH